MFTFEYSTVDYRKFLNDYAKALGVEVENDRVIFPSSIGNGYVQLIELPNELMAMIIDFTIYDQYRIEKIRSEAELYTLRYEDISIKNNLTVRIDSEELTKTEDHHAVIYLTSNLFDLSAMRGKGTHIKGFHTTFSKEWLAKYLGISDPDQALNTYIDLKIASLNIEPLDAEYKRLFHEIQEASATNPLWMGIVQNRIMLIIERFFSRLYEKKQSLNKHVRISKYDINSLIDIEQLLTKDLTELPPTIQELASKVSMSPAKLKRIFKEVYGSGIYSYYQKQRMQKAREMLLSGDYNVKEVGMHLGYSNLSNFATAFKKEFGILPGSINRQSA